MTTISEHLAAYVTSLSFEVLPQSTVAMSKDVMLDTIAVAWAGRHAPAAPEAHSLVIAEGGRGEATVWGHGQRLPATGAAFLNSLFGAALDFDAMNSVHADIVALPAALAIAEREHASGREFLTAYIAGTDLTCRLGAAVAGPHRGWFNTSVFGVFGAAAAAARLLKLDFTATAHALGIALSQAAGTQQAHIEQALTKRMQSAFAARAGVFSALLAAAGITAPRHVFEGDFGLYNLYQSGRMSKVLDGLGCEFEQKNTNLKKYPICACSHAAVEAAMWLVRQYDLKPNDVISVEVIHSAFMHRLVGAPFNPGVNAQVAAQFSVQYGVASALLRRRVGLSEIEAAAVLDPDVKSMTARVTVVVDEKSDASLAPATVNMHTRSHGRIRRTVGTFPWGPDAPPSRLELAAKVEECLSYGTQPLEVGRRRLLVERVREVENIDDMSNFFTGIV